MGRRALRKINPSIDLTGHLKLVEQLSRPWDAAALFGGTAPLEVEVGSGKGLFLRNVAADRPEVDFLGIEIAGKYARFAAAGLAKAGLRNALVVDGDATRLFHELLPDGSLAAVHVYFPDPWWKQRHRRRRVMRDSFVRDVERTLRARRLAPFLDRRGRVFPSHSRVARRRDPYARPLAGAGNAGRTRHGLSHPFRAPRPASQRAGLSGGVQQGSGQDNLTGVLAKDQRMIATYSSQNTRLYYFSLTPEIRRARPLQKIHPRGRLTA